ncbi:hypothetical protein BJV85_003043 [Clostridium acetobutylicum]|uniref:Uncharacterized protein n=1 Tax=Clostridium acetobutylicum (strain ATCC 824 / DSM 792 / JCM 1419 / IAM 19013 / LMG 5710 / NBRC 13948 / NRRL B-527 / VKM B-1787 / 2291 / W) TaxID=272562 RepID=Q97KF5_CLOAB|nr:MULTISPECIES: hypothetical protein [Clostridium]AAK78940.1 Hypothetical protein CA_C0964 [Clostridium acetobutylicum ATCC 824]ADZ20015.1 Conserved hypothetical protein [Clostridium acetobutylicum EA 2018]AEI31523.1 hypothetical protein SMB_G0981 [Clostridium acetobutylicum DSM 1731]AWV80659.1 hypothetical protein DK921_11220 [Clostridium acetobutylicum]MBC2396114.1 hypothetical protein [Clostridium acetobutylicum]
MNYSEIIEDIIKENKWIKNIIGMDRIRCVKLVKEKGKLMVIVVSDKLKFPICSFVRKIMVSEGEVILFYDGEYFERVEKGEYNRYKDYLDMDEWNIIMRDNPTDRLVEENKVSDREKFYVELHETAKDYINGKYDKKCTDELNHIYNL